jgi:hypothetical protein
MAGLGKKTFVAGEVLLAQDVNGYLMDQSVMVFGGTAARSSAIPTPTEGMMSYRTDDDVVEVFDGSAYVGVGGSDSGVTQVASTAKTDTFSSSSTSFTDITGLSVSITPSSASNKVLVIASVSAACDPTLTNISFLLVRESTSIALGDAAGTRVRSTMSTKARDNDTQTTQTIMFLDSPATTSSTTYKLQMKVAASTGYVNRSVSDTDSLGRSRTISTITVMEVKA